MAQGDDGRYYVYVCTPYDGLFMWHAENPRGPWSETVTVKAVDRWEDPAPFWDDELDALKQRMDRLNGKLDAEFKKDPKLTREAKEEARKKAAEAKAKK